MNTMTTVIETTSLSKSFSAQGGGTVPALNDVTWRVGTGEIIGLLGPNGAGKTTLIDLLLGLTRPTTGEVRLFGRSPRQAIADARVGAVMQTGGLLPDISVETTIRTVAATHRDPLPITEVLSLANLVDLRKRRVSKCSGGEQQRLRFALALLGRPDLLILDEPTAGMDAGARHNFWDSMAEQAHEGRTIIFATHYLVEAQNFAQRIVMLDRGRVIADGSTGEIRSMTAMMTVEATLPDTINPALISTPETTIAELNHVGPQRRFRFSTADSDSLARRLLNEFHATDLRIEANTIEDTFIALTGTASPEGTDS